MVIFYLNLVITDGVTSDKTQCTVTEKPPPETPQPEDGRASAASGKGGKKGGNKGAGTKSKKVPTPLPVTPPEPLRLEYKMERVKWNSFQDCQAWSQASAEVSVTANQSITTAPL